MEILCQLVNLYGLCIILRIPLSWFPIRQGTFLGTINNFLARVTEPVLAPVRRIIPPVGGGGIALDLSPMIVLILLYVVVRSAILHC